MQTAITGHAAPAQRSLWMHSPAVDALLGWCFLPIAVVVHFTEPHLTTVQALMGIIFILSFAHQPLTLGLVYGDPVQRDAHRRMYTWTPLVVVGLITLGINISLGLVAVIAGLWNAEHTLMQRYGVLRIYGRKAGDDNGRYEKVMFITWLVTALLYIGAFVDIDGLVLKLGLDENNARGVHALDHVRSLAVVLFWVGLVASIGLAARWWRHERPYFGRSPAKHLYAAGTLAMVVAVMVDPIAGVAGYVAAHAIEYFAVVHRSLRNRRDNAPVAVATSTPWRRLGVYVLYFSFIAWIVVTFGSVLDGKLYAYAILFFGALHIYYDGFVWKLRRPNVAASLGIDSPTPA